MKLNCWEHKRCGRELGGINSKELGICPATVEPRLNGVNSGKNGGRACWAVAGTLCGGKVQGTFASKVDQLLEVRVLRSRCQRGRIKHSESKADSGDLGRNLAYPFADFDHSVKPPIQTSKPIPNPRACSIDFRGHFHGLILFFRRFIALIVFL